MYWLVPKDVKSVPIGCAKSCILILCEDSGPQAAGGANQFIISYLMLTVERLSDGT
jgi:hypothetical protein